VVFPVRSNEIPVAVGTHILCLPLFDLILFVAILRRITSRPNCGDDFQSSYPRVVPPVYLLNEVVLKLGQVVTESACIFDVDLLS
jgi:hypothetical protein